MKRKGLVLAGHDLLPRSLRRRFGRVSPAAALFAGVFSLLCAAMLSTSFAPVLAAETKPPASVPSAPPAKPQKTAQAAPVAPAAPDTTSLPQGTSDHVQGAQTKINALKAEIDRVSAQLQDHTLTDKDLANLRTVADAIKQKADTIAADQGPDLDGANARLKQLGPAPAPAANGDPAPIESDAVRQERDSQQKTVAVLEGIVKQAKLVSLDADEVIKTVGDRRRTRFAETLTERTRSVLDPGLWVEAFMAVPSAILVLRYIVYEWFDLVAGHGGDVAIAFLCVLFAIIALLITPIRRHLFRLVTRDDGEVAPAQLRKVIAAAGVLVIQVGAPLVGLLIFMLALQALDLTRDRIDQIFLAFIEATTLGNAIFGLNVAILAPGKPQWRLVSISDSSAITLRRVSLGLGIATGIGLLLTRLLDILSTSINLVFAASGASAIIDAVFAMLALHVISRAVVERETNESDDDTPPSEISAPASIVWRWLLPVAWLAAIACVGAGVLGYISLSRFIGQQMIWFGVVMATLYIVLQVIDELVTAAFLRGSPFSTTVSRAMALGHGTVEQFGVLLSGIGRLLAIFIAFYFVRPPWSDSSYDVIASMKAAFFGIKIGNFTFSPASLLLALIAFAIGVAITRGVQRWLDNNFLPRTRMDLGLKNSISTGVGYAGYVVAAIVAFSAVGIGLENVALVAGALSVGIGFGLQSIVNNFVSGLILLAERPIKSGDLVQIGTEKGFVRKINVRSTEIETFDRASLIVPNSTLISGAVKNWMHRDHSGQVIVLLGVSYESDVDQVREIMLSCAKAHRLVQTFPSPSVALADFGPKALDFQLACTVANVNDAWNVQSDLRMAILKRFRKEGIDMPNAQRDLWVRGLEELPELLAGLRERGLIEQTAKADKPQETEAAEKDKTASGPTPPPASA